MMAEFPKHYFDDIDNVIGTAKASLKACDERGALPEFSREESAGDAMLVEVSPMDLMLLNAATVLLNRKPLGVVSDDKENMGRFIDLVGRISEQHVTVNFSRLPSSEHEYQIMFVPDGAPDHGEMPVFYLDRGQFFPERYDMRGRMN